MATKKKWKDWMDKQYDKRTRRTRRRPESRNTHQTIRKDTKKYQIGKPQARMEYMGSGSRNSFPFTTN